MGATQNAGKIRRSGDRGVAGRDSRKGGALVRGCTKSGSARRLVNVCVSDSHKDKYWMEALMPLLLFPGVHVKPWNDKEIKPGLRWDQEIKGALAEMDVFIPLVSVH